MIGITIAAMLAFGPTSAGSTPAQDPTVPVQGAPQQPATDLEDITVVGRPLERMIRDFVNEVASPNRNRGIARWHSNICVGVANLSAEPRQYIVDRVSTIAEDVGLRPGAPGCTPNVIVIATDQPDALAESLVKERRGAFRMGGAGMDRGGDALEDFVASDAPVRWWQVSMPTDSFTGQRAVRMPGECRNACLGSMDMAPTLTSTSSTRLSTQIVDNIFRTIVILDIDQVSKVSAQQLADYVALVTLAQIDPKADTSGYASILNVFDDPESATSLTNWDTAYLTGLYNAERTRANLRSGRGEIADSIERAHGRLQRTAQD